VNYVIAIPEPIQNNIASWNLSSDAEDFPHEQIEGGMTQEELDRLWRHAGPGSAYIWNLDFQDPVCYGLTYFFTFWLVFGPEPNYLYIYQAEYNPRENWTLENQYEDDDPDYEEN